MMAPKVQAVGLDPENARAAHAVERLEDDVVVLGMKAFDVQRVARDQGRTDELGPFQDGQFFRMVAQRAGLVEHPGALALGLLQQVGGVEKFAVERRVLAHHHRVEVLERLPALIGLVLGGAEPVHRITGERDVAHNCGHGLAALPHDVLGFAGADLVAAGLRLAHHGKGGVLVDLEGFQRVGDK